MRQLLSRTVTTVLTSIPGMVPLTFWLCARSAVFPKMRKAWFRVVHGAVISDQVPPHPLHPGQHWQTTGQSSTPYTEAAK